MGGKERDIEIMRHHKHMRRVLAKQLEMLYTEQSKSGAIGGMGSAVVVAPGPEQTTTATGRSRMATSTSAGVLKRFDPGELGSYKIPGRNMALRGIAGRRFGNDIFISIGTDYSKYLRRWGYEMMEHAQDGAVGQMEIDQNRTLRKVARV